MNINTNKNIFGGETVWKLKNYKFKYNTYSIYIIFSWNYYYYILLWWFYDFLYFFSGKWHKFRKRFVWTPRTIWTWKCLIIQWSNASKLINWVYLTLTRTAPKFRKSILKIWIIAKSLKPFQKEKLFLITSQQILKITTHKLLTIKCFQYSIC